MITCEFFIVIYKSINEYLTFSVLISNTVNIIKYHPYEQKAFWRP